MNRLLRGCPGTLGQPQRRRVVNRLLDPLVQGLRRDPRFALLQQPGLPLVPGNVQDFLPQLLPLQANFLGSELQMRGGARGVGEFTGWVGGWVSESRWGSAPGRHSSAQVECSCEGSFPSKRRQESGVAYFAHPELPLLHLLSEVSLQLGSLLCLLLLRLACPDRIARRSARQRSASQWGAQQAGEQHDTTANIQGCRGAGVQGPRRSVKLPSIARDCPKGLP